MNFGLVALKALIVLVLLFIFSLAGALTFPALSTLAGSNGAGFSSLIFLILVMLGLSVIGNLLGRGIRSIKKPLEALILTFVGSFFLGAAIALFSVLNIPNTARINLSWLGTNWYSPFLALLFIGAPIMLVFLVAE